MRIGRWVAVLGMVALLLVGCGGEGDQGTASDPGQEAIETVPDDPRKEMVHVTLAGQPGPESAGLVMADSLGYYTDAGLDIKLGAPASPLAPIGYVLSEVSPFGVSHQPQVELAQEKGAPIEIVGSMISQPTIAMIWLRKSKISGIADLKGKIIAIPGLPFQRELLEDLLEEAGLTIDDVKVRAVEYRLMSSLINGKVDAIFGGSANIEGIELETAGREPVVIPASKLDLPPYEELVLIARSDFVSTYPDAVRDFMSAVRKGTAAAIKHPKAAARAVDLRSESVSGTTRKEMEVELAATLPLLSRSGIPGS